ncbi:MAG: hypothetical protein J7K26_02840 [Candidatus Aenigmarchaeota archaeon]|nr:hypothetical protein [Candidatus Aenigmarchaeota archaeon]
MPQNYRAIIEKKSEEIKKELSVTESYLSELENIGIDFKKEIEELKTKATTVDIILGLIEERPLVDGYAKNLDEIRQRYVSKLDKIKSDESSLVGRIKEKLIKHFNVKPDHNYDLQDLQTRFMSDMKFFYRSGSLSSRFEIDKTIIEKAEYYISIIKTIEKAGKESRIFKAIYDDIGNIYLHNINLLYEEAKKDVDSKLIKKKENSPDLSKLIEEAIKDYPDGELKEKYDFRAVLLSEVNEEVSESSKEKLKLKLKGNTINYNRKIEIIRKIPSSDIDRYRDVILEIADSAVEKNDFDNAILLYEIAGDNISKEQVGRLYEIYKNKHKKDAVNMPEKNNKKDALERVLSKPIDSIEEKDIDNILTEKSYNIVKETDKQIIIQKGKVDDYLSDIIENIRKYRDELNKEKQEFENTCLEKIKYNLDNLTPETIDKFIITLQNLENLGDNNDHS